MRGSGAIMFSMDGGRTIDKNGAINVNKIQRKPWSFTIVFDEAKAVRHGYSLDALYDHVGKIAESFGNVRIGRGSWQAKASGVVLPVRAEVGDGEREELDHL